MDAQGRPLNRWQALDAIKTLGLLGALMGHIAIWWFAINTDPATSAYFKVALVSFWTLAACLLILLIVHLLFAAAGAALYLYFLKKPPIKKILLRIALFVLLGILFGFNIHPVFLAWNVFLLYALSVLIIFALTRYGNKIELILLTLGTLFMAPLLRTLLNKAAPGNYLSIVLAGDPAGKIGFYPLFPWFSLIGGGFLVANLYVAYGDKKFSKYGAWSAIALLLFSLPFLKPPDLTNIFGVTSQISIAYVVFVFGLFILLISGVDLPLKRHPLSRYNPVVAIGKHILPIYLVTVLITLPLTDALKRSARYGGEIKTFFAIELITLLIAFLSAFFLEKRSSSRERR